MTNIENTSAPTAPKMHLDTWDELKEKGSARVLVSCQALYNVARDQEGVPHPVLVQQMAPLYEAAGYGTLDAFCRDVAQRQLRASQAAAA